ncbi:MAG: nucleotidyltransferase domain-containing protein [Armatimonadetes bacterium]|nr:nucleotidyltransferase domain-containing protein [Armatimonadota bacterium]HOC31652.1 nucleotidyltransferase domain-containing protein [Armatimonadota bacterium]
MTPNDITTIVDKVVELTKPRRVILFGSSARGNTREDSDIDLLVVVETGTHRRKTAQFLYRELAPFGVPVDIVVATQDDIDRYRNESGYIYATALREGRTVYAA